MHNTLQSKTVAIIGAGPAGLIAAQTLVEAGWKVDIYDRMPTPARKFLMAGRGGLNLTHSEPLETFLLRYGKAAEWLTPAIQAFPPDALRAWCKALGHETFVGSSGRVFPQEFKASPLLRAWVRYLAQRGVTFHFHQQWMGWNDKNQPLVMDANQSIIALDVSATLLALGGASWPRLGADGGWVAIFEQAKIAVSRLRPANCGFAVNWSPRLRQRCAGQPIKSMRAMFATHVVRGEAMITDAGIEGGAIYALSSVLRDAIEEHGLATLRLDLRPELSLEQLTAKLQTPQGRQSRSTYLRKAAGLSPVALSLVAEALHRNPNTGNSPQALAGLTKSLPLTLTAPFGLERSISTAGGVSRDELCDDYMLRKRPGTFVAGEMLDWEAPTGGYLLQASFSTGVAAARGIMRRG